jgi:predicted nuclease with TOPRIM domain
MNSLSQEQIAERRELADRIREAHGGLEAEVERFNDQVAELREAVETRLTRLNEAMKEAEAWVGAIQDKMEEFCLNQPGPWLSTKAGEVFADWQDRFGVEYEKVRIKFPTPIETPDCDLAEQIESLPDAP